MAVLPRLKKLIGCGDLCTVAQVNRLLYRSRQRGFLEMDLLVGQFAERRLPQMSEPELAAFSSVLDQENPDLFKWLTGQEAASDAMQKNSTFKVRQSCFWWLFAIHQCVCPSSCSHACTPLQLVSLETGLAGQKQGGESPPHLCAGYCGSHVASLAVFSPDAPQCCTHRSCASTCRCSWRRTALPGRRPSQARPGCGAGTIRRSPWAGRRRLGNAHVLWGGHWVHALLG